MQITFRQIKHEDLEFLWRLHNAALKEYITRTWGWNKEHQQQMFEREFNPDDGKIILADGEDAGFFRVIEKESETLLVSIRLLPAYQKKGIGTKLIKDLLEKAEKPVKLQVLKINPARALYERLGFEVADETETHFLMKYQSKRQK